MEFFVPYSKFVGFTIAASLLIATGRARAYPEARQAYLAKLCWSACVFGIAFGIGAGYFLVFPSYDDFLDPIVELLLSSAFVFWLLIVAYPIPRSMQNLHEASLITSTLKRIVLGILVCLFCFSVVLSISLWYKQRYNPVGLLCTQTLTAT